MTKPNVTELSSAVITDNRLTEAMRKGRVVSLPDVDYVLAPTAAIAALADDLAEEELLAEVMSYRKNVTGVDNTVFFVHQERSPFSNDVVASTTGFSFVLSA